MKDATDHPMPSPLLAMPAEATCRGCGYSLFNLSQPRCPECGRSFDAERPESFRLPGGRRSAMEDFFRALWNPSIRGAHFASQTVVLGVLTVLIWYFERVRWRLGDPSVGSLYLLILIPIVCVRMAIAFFQRPRLEWPDGWRHRRSIVLFGLALLLLPAYANTWSHHCYHGDIYGIGPFGVGHMILGRGCPSTGHVWLPLVGPIWLTLG